jgi:hypothetical protein
VAARAEREERARLRFEAGLADPRFDVLVALSDGLGVGLAALMPDDEDGQNELAGSGHRQTSRLNSSRLIPAVRRMLPSVPLLIG